MNHDILAGAIRVLERQGPLKFTTIRVAEETGISVGSLYQYYPNKESLLFALHEREMQAAWKKMEAILTDDSLGPRTRVRNIALFFFQAESDEPSSMRRLMEEAQAQFRESPEYRRLLAQAKHRITRFLRQSLPADRRRRGAFYAEVFMTVIESVGRSVGLRGPSRADVRRWSWTCADLLCDHFGLTD